MQDTIYSPVVMTIAGLDPTGGAGIQADIETLVSLGCRPACVATVLTVQNTTNVLHCAPTSSTLVVQQARALLEDMKISAIKIGLVGNTQNVEAIHTILRDYPTIPVVLDPVIRAGGGKELASEETVAAINALLVPLSTVVTPNYEEARLLAPEGDSIEAWAMAILSRGAHYVLITGGHGQGKKVANVLYGNNRCLETHNWERLPFLFHGSGCTLSSAIAAYLAQKNGIVSATRKAQQYTHKCLQHAYRIGMGQHIPNRFFWTSK